MCWFGGREGGRKGGLCECVGLEGGCVCVGLEGGL